MEEEGQRGGPTTALLTDHYELTMVASALRSGVADRQAVFEAFARRLPAGRAYGVVGGVDRALEAVGRFRFDADTVDFLVERGVVDGHATADWLRDFRFSGDITGYAEGELFFPYSPVLTVTGSFAECVLLETVLLSVLNHDSAVASAAARMADAAGGRLLIEGGSRRTDPEAAVAAARAAHVGGFDVTSNLEAGRRHGIPTGGTTAHAFVLAHPSEEAAFAAQLATLGPASTYLVDTFDMLEGIRRAIGVVGPEIGGIRIDSGDLVDRAREARRFLDEHGATDCRIVVSGDLDEYRVAEIEAQEAPVDAYLVGTSLVTGSGHPTAQMIYKLVAIADEPGPDRPLRPVGKTSPGKPTVGGRKSVWRPVDGSGHFTREVLSVAPAEPPAESMTPQLSLVESGKLVAEATHPAEARARCAARRAMLLDGDRTPWPLRAPAIPTVWEGVASPPGNDGADEWKGSGW